MSTSNTFLWLKSQSQTADLIRSTDWDKSDLGPVSDWSPALRTAINLIIDSKIPMYLWWGPHFVNIYNDAYIELAGPKNHPRFFGKPAEQMWSEIWPTLTNFLNEVQTTGSSILYEDHLLPLEREGFTEEAYFTFSYGPARDENGDFKGIFCTCYETTKKINSQRIAENTIRDFQEFFAQSPIPLCILMGPEHRYSMANPPYSRLVNKKDLEGKTITEAFSDQDMKPFVELLNEVYTTGVPFVGKDVQFPVMSELGIFEDHWLDFGYHPFRDENGAIKGIITIAIDVTEKYLSRLMAEKSIQDFKELANYMPQIVWTSKPNGDLDYFNDVWFDYCGTGLEDNIGYGWAKYVHPDDLGLTASRWKHSLETLSNYSNEFRLRRNDGKYRWFIARAYPIMDKNGHLVKWVGTNTDIHESKTFTYQLESETLKFETLFSDSATSMALLRGRDLIFEKVNPSYHELFDNRVVIGLPILEVLPEIQDQPFSKLLKNVYETGIPYREEEAYAQLKRTHDGPLEERYFRQSYTQVKDAAGNPYGVFIHAIEITDAVNSRKKLADLAQDLSLAVATRDEFMSIASHELKTPLTSMRLHSQSLQRMFAKGMSDEMLKLRTLKFVTNNDNQVSRLIRLIDDMLDISRIQSGKLSIISEKIDLKEIITDVFELLKEQLENAGCQASLNLQSGAVGIFDRSRMEQVITNLLTNAIRYGAGKEVKICLIVENGIATLRVKDHGKGIAPENLEKIFDRFERIITKNEVGGLGLGLYITRQIVQAHKGKIWAESTLGEGSIFFVEIPL